jgi:hypothetical protein
MNKEFIFGASSQEIKAEAFDIIAKFVHEQYDSIGISNITPDEAFFVTVVTTTEDFLGAFRPEEET